MNKSAILLLTLSYSLFGFAQTDEDPVRWEQELNKISDTEFELVFKADILEDWHVYSQFTSEGGSQPSEFVFENLGEAFELIGIAEESETITEYSEIFEVEEIYFKERLSFKQKIKLLAPDIKQIKVLLYYQVCNEVCIPKEQEFIFSLDGGPINLEEKTVDERSMILSEALVLDLKNKKLLFDDTATTTINSNSSLWMIFCLGFLGGLIALLTPCVFPMIPLTVSFFTKHSVNKSKGKKNAMLYGFFIVLIYFLLSLPFHLFDSVDSQILNTISTNEYLNILFFVIFVFFAFSFFGYYELTLPSAWANKMDNASSKAGGILGIFFMAVTLAIVSFSCTGPILGGLLGSTALAEGDVATNLSTGMLGFGTALALPFALFALFPTWLNSLPKSGGWMTTVKVTLGFLELALAFKFLSNADLVGNWGILKRELFIGIWMFIFTLLALYLFGKIRFPHDGPKHKLAPARKLIALVSTIFALYLALGLAKLINLKLLSGFPPPEFYSIFEQKNDCPLGLTCFKDFDKGMTYAKEVNKPVLLDFTGWACVNCRKMEENVWSEPDIHAILQEDFVIISLYVDDRKELPILEQFDYKYESGRVKHIQKVGQKWGTFQSLNFNAASQPYYVLLSPDLEVLNASIQYTDSETYKLWLLKGLENFDE